MRQSDALADTLVIPHVGRTPGLLACPKPVLLLQLSWPTDKHLVTLYKERKQ